MTTLFLNTSSGLPRTSYFKMIDIWMVFGLMLPFFEVVLHTVTEYQRREAYEDEVSDDPEVAEVVRAAAASARRKRIPTVDAVEDEAERDRLLKKRKNNNEAAATVAVDDEMKQMSRLCDRLRSTVASARRPTFFSLTVHFSRTIVPLLVVLFNVIYWTVAFLHN